MNRAAWRLFDEELARWRDAGRSVEFWWRDDDAARLSPALGRLLALSSSFGVPLAVAVIPERAEQALFRELGDTISILQHGTDHLNRAAPGEKKTEFPSAEPVRAAVARLAVSRDRLRAMSGDRALPVLAPPWNRLPSTLIPDLSAAGFRGLSRYGARVARAAAPAIVQVNTHVDIIAWQAHRGFVGAEAALADAVRHLAARRTGSADGAEATGWLTHHECHDETAWHFLGRLFETTIGRHGVHWRRADQLFAQS